MWRWIWLIGWSVVIVAIGWQVIVEAEHYAFVKGAVVAVVFAFYAVTLARWLPRRQDTVALFRGTFTPFACSYVLLAVTGGGWVGLALSVFLCLVIYGAFVADGRFQNWLTENER